MNGTAGRRWLAGTGTPNAISTTSPSGPQNTILRPTPVLVLLVAAPFLTLAAKSTGAEPLSVPLSARLDGQEGETAVDIACGQPQNLQGIFLTGIVVDEAGEPVPDLYLSFGTSSQATLRISGNTDGHGQFRLGVKDDPHFEVRSVRASERRTFGDDGYEHSVYVDLDVTKGGEFSVQSPADLLNHRIVVRSRSPRLLKGGVTDEAGAPIHGLGVSLVPHYPGRGVQMLRRGFFAAHELPKTPFLLVATAPGYQARATVCSAAPTDEMLHITLRKGPFPEGISVFEAVTGRPPTPEGLASLPWSNVIRESERAYIRMANEGKRPRASRPREPVMPAGGWPLRISDPEGRPVKRVYAQSVVGLGGSGGIIRPETVRPCPDAPRLVLIGEHGLFRIPELYMAIWTDASAYGYFHDHAYETPSVHLPLETLILYPSGKLTVHVVGEDGRPVEGVAVRHALDYGTARQPLLTLANGQASMDRLVPGEHAISVTAQNGKSKVVYPFVVPGRTVRIEVRLGGVIDEGSAADLLESWNWYAFEPLPQRPVFSEAQDDSVRKQRRDTLLAGVTRKQRKALGEELVHRIYSVSRKGNRVRELVFYTGVARHLQLDDALDAVQAHLLHLEDVDLLSSYDSVVQSLVDARGDRLTPYFHGLAANTDASPAARILAIAGLGKVGSKRSVKAFQELRDRARELRDRARELPGAPQTKPAYTHGERMAETLALAIHFMPWGSIEPTGCRQTFSPDSAQVSEDYLRGNLSARDAVSCQGYTTYYFRRFGDEWLLTSIGHTIMS